MDTSSLMGFAVLGSMKKAERKRAQTPLLLTMVPGPPATRAAFATVAVGNQASDGLRREKRVATAVVGAAEAIAAGQPAASAFAAQAALRDLAPDLLAARFAAAYPVEVPAEVPAEEVPEVDVTNKKLWAGLGLATAMLIEAVNRPKGLLFTADEAEKFDDYLDLLSGEDRDRIVKPAEVE